MPSNQIREQHMREIRKVTTVGKFAIALGIGALAGICALVSGAQDSTAIGLGLGIAGGMWLKLPKIIHC